MPPRPRAALAGLLLVLLAPSAAAAAPQPVGAITVNWKLGQRLDSRLSGRCVLANQISSGVEGGLDAGALYHAESGAEQYAPRGRLDLTGRRGDAHLGEGALRFKSSGGNLGRLDLKQLGLGLRGQRAYVTAAVRGKRVRVARLTGLKVRNVRFSRSGELIPNSLGVLYAGRARAMAPLARLGGARCAGSPQASRPTGVHAGAAVGRVQILVVPTRGAGSGGGAVVDLAVRGGTTFAQGTPLAPATADDDGVRLAVPGGYPIRCMFDGGCFGAGTVATQGGLALSANGRTVELRDLQLTYRFSLDTSDGLTAPNEELVGISAVFEGARTAVVVEGPGGRDIDPAFAARLAATFGVASVSLDHLNTALEPARTAPAP